MSRLFVHAINVHHGGGAVLLCDLLRAIPPHVKVVANVDARMELPANLPDHIRVDRTAPTLPSRLAAEWRLMGMVEAEDQILCFGNLPPLFKLRGKVVVFLQNRFLVDPCSPLGSQPLKARVRLHLERVWLRLRSSYVSYFIVQTATMRKLTSNCVSVPVICAPWLPTSVSTQVSEQYDKKYDFVYVASGDAHKNHQILFQAWALLADQGIFPSLVVTLTPEDMSVHLASISNEINFEKLHIHNLGVVSHEVLLRCYGESGALIYPSRLESFGLPLIEAKKAGLPILAPELDYVRDVVCPIQTFDPDSSLSICRAIKRFLRHEDQEIIFLSPEDFVSDYVLQRSVGVKDCCVRK